MKALILTIPIALLIAGCETTSDDPLGIINEIVEKGVEAGDKARKGAQTGAREVCDLLRDRPDDHQAIRDWVWENPETGEIVGDRVHLVCEGGLQ